MSAQDRHKRQKRAPKPAQRALFAAELARSGSEPMQSFSLPNGRFSPSVGDALEDERKRLEEALRESEERFRGLFEASHWGLLIHDEGRILDANPTLAMIFGYEISELVGMEAPHLVAPEWRDFTLQKRLAGCEEPYEAVSLKRDGTTFPVQLCGKAVRSNGRVVRMVAVRELTERKRAEEALRESEKKFRHVLDSSLDMVYCLNLKTFTYDYLSPSCEEVLGYSPEEFAALGFMGAGSQVHPDDVQRVLENFAQVRTHPNIEYRFRHKELGYRWMSDSRSVVFDDKGGAAVVGALRDITERKRAEEALRGSEERFRLIAQAASDGIWDWDLVTGAVWWNEGIRKLIGHAPSDLGYAPSDVGANLARWYGHVDAADRNRVMGSVWAVIQSGEQSWSQEYRVRWADGSSGHVLGRGYVIRDGAGKPVRMIGGITDITERKRAEQELDYQAQLLASVNDAIISTDEQFVLKSWNPAAERIYGWKAEEVLGRPASEVLRTEFPGAERSAAIGAAVGAGNFHGEVVQYRKDGTAIHVESKVIALRDGGGRTTGYVGVNRDITDRKRAEEALQNLATLPGENPNPIIRAARDGTVIFTNQSSRPLLELWGCAEGAALPPQPYQLVESALTAGKLVTGEILYGERTFLVICAPIAERDYVNIYGVDITERKRAEEALRESEQRYRLLADNVSDIIATRDLQLRATHMSPAVTEILGYTVEEAMDKSIEELLTPASLEIARNAYAEELAMEETGRRDPSRSVTLELEHIAKNGSAVWLEVRVTALHDEDGRAIGILGVSRDISERRRAQLALEESEKRYRLLAENATDIIWIRDLNLRTVYVNPAVTRIRGYSIEEVMAQPLEEVLTPASLELARKVFAEELAEEQVEERDLFWWRTLELEHNCKDGSTVWLEVKVTALRDEDGRMVGILGISRDISERKRAEEALQKTREELESRVERRMRRGSAYGLTFRELTVLHLVVAGKSDKEIAAVLGISALTASKHLGNILRKMGASSRTEAGVRAVKEGLLD